MTKQINKKNIIYIILACVLVIAIIIGIIFAYNKNKENKKVDEKAETKIEQLAEQATVELPKDYKGEVEIIEQEIKDEKTGEKKTVIKTVPKGTKIKGAKVIGTTTTEKIKETTTKAPTTKAPTQKPTENTTNKPTQKPTQKPNTTKPNTTQGKLPTPPHIKNALSDEKKIAKIAEEYGLIYDWEYDVREQNCSWTGFWIFKTEDILRENMELAKANGKTRIRHQRVDKTNYKTFTPEALDPDYFPQSSYENLCRQIENWKWEDEYCAYEFYCYD